MSREVWCREDKPTNQQAQRRRADKPDGGLDPVLKAAIEAHRAFYFGEFSLRHWIEYDEGLAQIRLLSR